VYLNKIKESELTIIKTIRYLTLKTSHKESYVISNRLSPEKDIYLLYALHAFYFHFLNKKVMLYYIHFEKVVQKQT